MTKLEEKVCDVVFNRQATSTVDVLRCIVPFKVYAGKFGTLPVLSDGVVLLEDVAEAKGVALAKLFNAKFVNNDG